MEKSYPKVSIISSSYNHIQFIDNFVKSVFDQDYPNFELIMIDDGSKDGCGSRLKELAESYNFKAIIRENKGFPNALNTLIPLSTGDYIVIIAADDMLLPNRVTQQVEFLETHKSLGLVASDMQEIDENGNKGEIIKRPFTNGNLFEDLFLSNLYLLAPTVMVRRSLFEEVGPYDESLVVEDFDMWMRMAQKSDFGYLNILATYYRKHSGNDHGNYKRGFEQRALVLKKYKEHKLFHEAFKNFNQGAFLFLSRLLAFSDLAKEYKSKSSKYGFFTKTHLKGLVKYHLMSKI